MKKVNLIYCISTLLLISFLYSCSHEVVQPKTESQQISSRAEDAVVTTAGASDEEMIAKLRKRYEESEKIDGIPTYVLDGLKPEDRQRWEMNRILRKNIKHENMRSYLTISEEDAVKLGITPELYRATKTNIEKGNAKLDSLEAEGVSLKDYFRKMRETNKIKFDSLKNAQNFISEI